MTEQAGDVVVRVDGGSDVEGVLPGGLDDSPDITDIEDDGAAAPVETPEAANASAADSAPSAAHVDGYDGGDDIIIVPHPMPVVRTRPAAVNGPVAAAQRADAHDLSVLPNVTTAPDAVPVVELRDKEVPVSKTAKPDGEATRDEPEAEDDREKASVRRPEGSGTDEAAPAEEVVSERDIALAKRELEAAAAQDQEPEKEPLRALPVVTFGEAAKRSLDTDAREKAAADLASAGEAVTEQLGRPEAEPSAELAEQIRAVHVVVCEGAATHGYDVTERAVPPERIRVYAPSEWAQVVGRAANLQTVELKSGEATVGLYVPAGDLLVVAQSNRADTLQTVQRGVIHSAAAPVYELNRTGSTADSSSPDLNLVQQGYADAPAAGQVGRFGMLSQCVAAESTRLAVDAQWTGNAALQGMTATTASAANAPSDEVGQYIIQTVAADRAEQTSGMTTEAALADTVSMLEQASMVGDRTVVENLLEDSFGAQGAAIIAEWGRPGGHASEGMIRALETVRAIELGPEETSPAAEARPVAQPAGDESFAVTREDEGEVLEGVVVTDQEIADATADLHRLVAENALRGEQGALVLASTVPGQAVAPQSSSAVGAPEDVVYDTGEGREGGPEGLQMPLTPEAEGWVRDTAAALGVAHAHEMSVETLCALMAAEMRAALHAGAGRGVNINADAQQARVYPEDIRRAAEAQAALPPEERWTGPLAAVMRGAMLRTMQRTARGVSPRGPGGGQESLAHADTLDPRHAPIVLGAGARPRVATRADAEYASIRQYQASLWRAYNAQRHAGRTERATMRHLWANEDRPPAADMTPEETARADAARAHVRDRVLFHGQITRQQWRLMRRYTRAMGRGDYEAAQRALWQYRISLWRRMWEHIQDRVMPE